MQKQLVWRIFSPSRLESKLRKHGRLETAMFDAPYKIKWWGDKPRSLSWESFYDLEFFGQFTTDDGRKGLIIYSIREANRTTGIELDMAFDIDGDQHVTGEGDALRIFATVTNSLTGFLTSFPTITGVAQHNITRISFTAYITEKSKVKLYKRLARRMSQKHGFNSRVKKEASGVKFIMHRPLAG